MKKKVYNTIAVILVLATMSSCATIFGGTVSECQRIKPVAGQPQRQVRVAALVANIILFWPGAVVDFATGAIYRPCDINNNVPYNPRTTVSLLVLDPEKDINNPN